MKLTLLSVLSLIVACGGGGLTGEYTNKDGTFVYNFKGRTVTINGKFMGQEIQRETSYEFADGKLKVWEPAKPEEKLVLTIDDKGCFDIGDLFVGKVCPKGSWS